MYACPAENPRRMIYRCLKTHLGRGLRDVDEVVEAAVIARLSQRDAVDLFAPDVDLDALRGRVTQLRERRDGLAGLLADGLLSPSAVRQQAAKLTAKISGLERDILAATGDGPLANIIGADDVAATWARLPLLAKREVIDTLMMVTILPAGKGVTFAPEQVHIEWRSR
jgi:site-specific DNA recombinase